MCAMTLSLVVETYGITKQQDTGVIILRNKSHI